MIRSAKRSPRSLCEPRQILRQRTKPRSSCSEWLFVGSTPGVDESPEGSPVHEDVLAAAADATNAERSSALEQPLDVRSESVHLPLEAATAESAVANTVPFAEEQLREEHQTAAELGYRLVLALGEFDELSHQVRPADLAPLYGPEEELSTAVADENAAGAAQEAFHRLHGPIGGDLEHRRELGGEHPQRPVVASPPPGRAIGMFDTLGGRVLVRLLDGYRQRRTDAVLELTERPERVKAPKCG